jgi:hypothetical protein
MSETMADPLDLAQRAAGVLAARRRGDHTGATTLLAEFGDADQRALGFYLVADLSLLLLAQATGQPLDQCVRDVSLALANGQHDPPNPPQDQ